MPVDDEPPAEGRDGDSAERFEHDTDDEAMPRTPDGGSSGRLAWTVAVVLGVIATAATAVAVLDPFDPAPATEAAEVARETTVLLLGLDAGDAQETQSRLEELAAGAFLEEVQQAFTAGLADVLAEADSDAEADVTRVYLDEESTAGVSAITVAAVTRSGGVLATPGTFEVYLELELLRVDDRWRVVQVTNLDIGGRPRPPAPGPTTPASPSSPSSGMRSETPTAGGTRSP